MTTLEGDYSGNDKPPQLKHDVQEDGAKEKGTSSDGEKIATFTLYHNHDKQSWYQQGSLERQHEDLRDAAHPQTIFYLYIDI